MRCSYLTRLSSFLFCLTPLPSHSSTALILFHLTPVPSHSSPVSLFFHLTRHLSHTSLMNLQGSVARDAYGNMVPDRKPCLQVTLLMPTPTISPVKVRTVSHSTMTFGRLKRFLNDDVSLYFHFYL